LIPPTVSLVGILVAGCFGRLCTSAFPSSPSVVTSFSVPLPVVVGDRDHPFDWPVTLITIQTVITPNIHDPEIFSVPLSHTLMMNLAKAKRSKYGTDEHRRWKEIERSQIKEQDSLQGCDSAGMADA
jgi:hypothetical protein